jgi:hypothetical protein
MATKSEVLKTANLLVDTYGEMAPAGAKIRADHLQESGDIQGRAVWLRIAREAERLLSQDRPKNAILH